VNVASGTPRTILELATELARAAGTALSPVIEPRFRVGDVRHVFASTLLAGEALRFSAQVTFEDGIAEFARAPMRDHTRRSPA
jgi:dTDP-L-rhamnose 4-epimerase